MLASFAKALWKQDSPQMIKVRYKVIKCPTTPYNIPIESIIF